MRPNNNVANSKITFGGYEPGLLYPNSSSEIVWAPRIIENDIGAVANFDISMGNITLQNESSIHFDSFFPGIVLPKVGWTNFMNYVE
jgi:hypothetical protein